MPTLPALLPLRHAVFRSLWIANVIAALGAWMQNIGAGWPMTSLSQCAEHQQPDSGSDPHARPAAGLVCRGASRHVGPPPVPERHAGCDDGRGGYSGRADLCQADRRRRADRADFRDWQRAGDAQPAWGATVPEVVPRQDLVFAIALNGIGFNLPRTLGPALGISDDWLETWAVESWTDHRHGAKRRSDWNRLVLARASTNHDAAAPLPCRYIAVEPGPRASQLPSSAASLATHAGSAR